MRRITRNFYAEENPDGWKVFGVSSQGYPFTLRKDCEGFNTFRNAYLFTTHWLSRCRKVEVCPSSRLGRDIAHRLKESYQDWLQQQDESKNRKRA